MHEHCQATNADNYAQLSGGLFDQRLRPVLFLFADARPRVPHRKTPVAPLTGRICRYPVLSWLSPGTTIPGYCNVGSYRSNGCRTHRGRQHHEPSRFSRVEKTAVSRNWTISARLDLQELRFGRPVQKRSDCYTQILARAARRAIGRKPGIVVHRKVHDG